MKKFYPAICFCFLFLFPLFCKAETVTVQNFYVQMTVLENGDLRIQELMEIDGSINGMDRDIQYANLKTIPFDGSQLAFQGSKLYNGSGIILHTVKAIDVSKETSYATLFAEGKKMEQVNSAKVGEDLKYTKKSLSNGIQLRIYHPSKQGKSGIYLDYTIQGVLVKHQDSAELYRAFLNENFRDPIEYLEIHLTFPKQTHLRKGFGHGPLYGEVLIKENEIWYTAMDMEPNTGYEIRALFDRDLLNDSAKTSGVEAIEKIIQVETDWANEANQKRKEEYLKMEAKARDYTDRASESLDREQYEEARKWVSYLKEGSLKTELTETLDQLEPKIRQRERILHITGGTISVLWFCGLIGLFIYVYRKYDKEYEPTFKGQYYRDFPDSYEPHIVDYLMYKKVDYNDLSATLLNLIVKKHIQYEVIGKEDYVLSYSGTAEQLDSLSLSKSEKYLMKWLFFDLFKEHKFQLSTLKKKAKSGYRSFLKKIETWKNIAIKEANGYRFYEKQIVLTTLGTLYSLLGGIFVIISQIICRIPFYIPIITLFLLLIGFIYFLTFQRRTKEGNESYAKWKGLRNFLNDFGNFAPKELPEVTLWEKYLVYAMVFGCAKKLNKAMKLKVTEMYPEGSIDMPVSFPLFYTTLGFQSAIQKSISTAIDTAVARSTYSSGSGTGGGFSSGGGFSGGGMGGGSGGGHF